MIIVVFPATRIRGSRLHHLHSAGDSISGLNARPWAKDCVVRDVFVHISALERSGLTALNEGERVTVDVVEGRKGLEAARIRLS
jgi:cold shock CspA family protein